MTMWTGPRCILYNQCGFRIKYLTTSEQHFRGRNRLTGRVAGGRQGRTLRWGYLWRIWACRRRLALPTRAPSGRSARLEAVGEMKASRTSSLGRLHGKIVPSGRYVGTSCR